MSVCVCVPLLKDHAAASSILHKRYRFYSKQANRKNGEHTHTSIRLSLSLSSTPLFGGAHHFVV